MFKAIFGIIASLFSIVFNLLGAACHLSAAAQARKEMNEEIARIKNEADLLERKRQLEQQTKSRK
ncbi:hypothetical protein [Aliivibrio fischeri]|uniref:hypothetical protein n=1 Tax=Aliivibrio fischeri TaxID=668 RepID=UPI0012D89D3E|nr:hypothetical protein [Aliivibrio fischeri]MUI54466.1 hypothetical protein [Aliivibrio fischeri]